MLDWNHIFNSLFIADALKGTILLVAAGAIAFLLRGRSAAARHLVWTAAFAGLLILPLFSALLPTLRVPMATIAMPNVIFQSGSSVSANRAASAGLQAVSGVTPLSSERWHLDSITWLLLLWAAGAALSFGQVLLGYVAMWRVRHVAKRLVLPEISALTRAFGLREQPAVLESAPGAMPMTFGLFRPAIFMPAGSSQWPQDRCRIVLLHELAHARRGDPATQLLARIALSFYWWNPLAWIAWREFLKERERAADDLVLSAGAGASDYAGHLLEIARTMQCPLASGSAAVAFARGSQLEHRLLAILDSGRNRQVPGRAWSAVAVVLALGIVAPLAAMQAQDDTSPSLPANPDAAIAAALVQNNPDSLDNAAKNEMLLQHYDIAQKLLDSALAIRSKMFGQQSAGYALGLFRLGDLEREQGRFVQAENFYHQALPLFGDDPQAATTLLRLGTVALLKKEPDQALADFKRAEQIDPRNAGTALTWMAVAAERQERMDDAATSYQQALNLESPDSPSAATTLELYANLLRRQGRQDEAKSAADKASDIRKAEGAQVLALAQNPGPNVYRAGKGLTPTLISKVEPAYSADARAAKYQGTVTVNVEIAPDGRAHNMKIIRGLGLGLNDRAIAAISQWTFSPALKDGQPVTVSATIEVNYRLF